MRAYMVCALAAFTAGCVPNEEMSEKSTGGSGKLMTIMVGTESGSNTRVAYDDGQDLSLSWEVGDKLAVIGINGGGTLTEKKNYSLVDSDAGKTKGSFTGEELEAAYTYNVYYPSSVVPDGGLIPKYDLDAQTQNGDNSTAHLKNYIFLSAIGVSHLGNITLNMTSSILKFKLSHIPKDVGLLEKLRWVVETTNGEKAIELTFSTAEEDRIVFSDSKNELTAYLAFIPEDMQIKQGGKFNVELIGEKDYKAEITVDNGKSYEAGHRYTAEIGMQDGALQWISQMISIRVSAHNATLFEQKPIEIGTSSDGLLGKGVIKDGEVEFKNSLFSSLRANSDIWICIPKVVKYVYKLETDGLHNDLVLPDKDAGSTLRDEPKAGGKRYVNDWIVALYMGVEGGYIPRSTPIYWATGNLIATKVEYDAYLHIATPEETLLEASSDKNYFPDGIISDEFDGYQNCAEGSQWNLFPWNKERPTFTADEIYMYMSPDKGDISGNFSFDLCTYVGGSNFRLPLSDNTTNFDRGELDALMWSSTVGGLSSEVWEVDGTILGRKFTYIDPYEGFKNTLVFPFTGKAIGDRVESLGDLGYYWSGTDEDMEHLMSDKGYCLNIKKINNSINKERLYRHNRMAMRPVTE